MQKTVEIPVSLISKISRAAKAFEEVEDELEDFLLSQDPKFLEKMHKAKKAHLAGKTMNFKIPLK